MEDSQRAHAGPFTSNPRAPFRSFESWQGLMRVSACARAFGLEVAQRHLRHRLVAAERADKLHELQHGPDAVRLATAALLHVLACPPAHSPSSVQHLRPARENYISSSLSQWQCFIAWLAHAKEAYSKKRPTCDHINA